MANDGQDVLVGDDVLRVGHAHVRLSLVVVGHERDLVTHLLKVALEVLNRELGAELDALTEGRLTATERALGGDLDRALAALGFQVRRSRQRYQAENGQESECEMDRVADHRGPSSVLESA